MSLSLQRVVFSNKKKFFFFFFLFFLSKDFLFKVGTGFFLSVCLCVFVRLETLWVVLIGELLMRFFCVFFCVFCLCKPNVLIGELFVCLFEFVCAQTQFFFPSFFCSNETFF